MKNCGLQSRDNKKPKTAFCVFLGVNSENETLDRVTFTRRCPKITSASFCCWFSTKNFQENSLGINSKIVSLPIFVTNFSTFFFVKIFVTNFQPKCFKKTRK